MTERLYYHDSYQVDFQARIVERLSDDGRFGFVLDRTLFYPTSGGQPHDIGNINDIAVNEILVREADDAVVHWLTEQLDSDHHVMGHVDWPIRFDHMQQHTGQHILSQAFERTAGAATVGFHMSAEASTIDLETTNLTSEQITEAEQLANDIVWQDRPVSIRFATPAEARQMPLRKIPLAKDGLLRLIDIESFDLSACGGTHVRQTGEIGIIKVTRSERQGGNSRVEFLCGQRALEDYDRKNRVLARLSSEMTTGYWEIENAIARLRADLKQANRDLKRKNSELIQFEAQDLAQKATEIAGRRIITRMFVDRDLADLRRLASTLASDDQTIVLFGLAGPKSHLLFARSDDLDLAVNDLLRKTLPLLGEATGGGSPKFAQGGGPLAGEVEVRNALATAETAIRETLTAPTS